MRLVGLNWRVICESIFGEVEHTSLGLDFLLSSIYFFFPPPRPYLFSILATGVDCAARFRKDVRLTTHKVCRKESARLEMDFLPFRSRNDGSVTGVAMNIKSAVAHFAS